MPARKPPPPDEKPQRERFIEAARDLGTSEKAEDFERAFSKVIRHPAAKTPTAPLRADSKQPLKR